MPGRFFDSNVLLYLASSDARKAERADAVLTQGGATSVQVLNEIANVAHRKMRLPWEDTRTFLSLLRGTLTIHPVTIETYDAGLALAERYNLSTFDAMIAASALQADCDILWSEDMQHGVILEKRLRVFSPFE